MHHEELSAKQKFLKSFSAFLSGKWKIIVAVILVILALSAVAAVYSEIRTSINEKSTAMIEEIEEKYKAVKNTDNGESGEQDFSEIIASLDSVISKYKNYYAGQRALFIKADIFFNQKSFDTAAETYKILAERYSDSYLAPIALTNAAISHEEAGEIDSAIDQYKSVYEKYKGEYPDIPRILFSIARLYESQENYQEAADYYTILISSYTNSDWTNLARNRIIYLKAEGRIST